MTTQPNIPIDVVDLLSVLDKKLLELLKTLKADEWNKQTIAKLLTVKDAESKNWMEIAREYTEKWLHQQQIRDTANKAAHNWMLTKDNAETATAEIIIDPDTSGKLFSKSLRPEKITDKVKILGEQKLGESALKRVSVMA